MLKVKYPLDLWSAIFAVLLRKESAILQINESANSWQHISAVYEVLQTIWQQ